MGTVYLAIDEMLGRQVAVKLISDKLGESQEARTRFLREARMMATVEHANIVRIYAFEEFEANAYLVMQYVEGESLSDRIKRMGMLSVEHSLQILCECLEALEAAWEKE